MADTTKAETKDETRAETAAEKAVDRAAPKINMNEMIWLKTAKDHYTIDQRLISAGSTFKINRGAYVIDGVFSLPPYLKEITGESRHKLENPSE